MSKYEVNFTVNNFECNKFGLLSEVNFLKFLGESALIHSDSCSLEEKLNQNKNTAWMIQKWKVEINKYPKALDNIEIKTWSSDTYKFYASREYEVYLAKDKIAKASSVWLYIDLDRRMPTRIPKKFKELFALEENRIFEDYANLDYDISDFKEVAYEEIVKREDIDYNNHVNNAVYFKWMIESIEDKYYEEYILKDVEILYKKETMYKDRILVYNNYNIKENTLEVEHLILEKDSMEYKTYGKTIWEKR